MNHRFRTARAAALGIALSVGLPGCVVGQATTPQASASPTLVVMLTIDQMRPDYFPRFERQLAGGLARLYQHGAVLTHAFQDHANTETAPGHATILSGREPRHTGIVLNDLGVPDSLSPIIVGAGAGASPFRFRGSVLMDWMRIKDQRSRGLSISRKDRAAILPMGRAKQSVFWYSLSGFFTTSSYYGDTLPTWMRTFNARRLPQTYTSKSWELLLAPSQYPERDSVPVENAGRDLVFPHLLPTDTLRAVAGVINYPWMDEITLQAALAGVNALSLGTGPAPDLLSVSLSSTDAVGHRYGPDSRELHDQILRLDRSLGAFIDSLYKLRDSSRIVFVLTADHGVTSFPELQTGIQPPPRWVTLAPIFTRLRAALTARGLPATAVKLEEAFVTVDRNAFAAARVNADSVMHALAAEIRQLPGVARIDTLATVARKDTVRDDIARRWYHAVPPDLPMELGITLEKGSVWANSASNAMHGAPWDSDAAVPIIFYGPAFIPGRYTSFTRVTDIAPTLARVLGTTPTEALDGRVLVEILKGPR